MQIAKQVQSKMTRLLDPKGESMKPKMLIGLCLF